MFPFYTNQPRSVAASPSQSYSAFFSCPHPPTVATTPLDDYPLDDYEAYDAQRSAVERRVLAAKQQERRDAEEAALRLHHQKQLEAERLQEQQRAIYEALAHRQAQEAAYRVAVQQRQREQAYQLAAKAAIEREQEQYEAVRREVERTRVLQAQAQAQGEAHAHAKRRQASQAQESHGADIDPLQHFLSQLFGQLSHCAPIASTVAPEQPSTTSFPVVPTPVVDSTPTPSPIPTTTTPTPAPVAESSSSTAIVDAAAETLQRHFRAHLARRTALKALSDLSASFATHQADYVPPTSLVFAPSSPSPAGGASPAKLAYSSTNAPFLAYEDSLVGLLTKADGVPSGGDKVVKQARKELVRSVEEELRRLDERREAEWAKASSVVELPVPAAHADSSAAATYTLDSTPVSNPIPTSSPLDAPTPTVNYSPSPVSATPLTPVALASLPSDCRHRRRASSDSDSTTTTSTITFDVEDIVDQVMRAAEKLGQEVVSLESAEAGAGVVA